MIYQGDALRSGDQLDFRHLHESKGHLIEPWILDYRREAQRSALEKPKGFFDDADLSPRGLEIVPTPGEIIQFSTLGAVSNRRRELRVPEFWADESLREAA